MKVQVTDGIKEEHTIELDDFATLQDVTKALIEKGVSVEGDAKYLYENLVLVDSKPLYLQRVRNGSRIHLPGNRRN